MIYIFDLDGTLADNSHRLHHIQGESQNWRKYQELCDKDTPIEATILVARALKLASHTIIILTGRSDHVREETRVWLDVYDVPYDKLIMREKTDFRPDTEYKSDMLEKHINGEVKAVFEDRNSMIQWWRSQGILCYDVGRADA